MSAFLSPSLDRVRDFQPLLVGLSLIFCYGLYRLLQVGRRDPRMPPGPPTLPIIGNLHQMPLTGMYKQFKTWGEQYNGIYSLKFGPTNFIVLYDRKAIHELVDKKGTIYADRPTSYVADLVTSSQSLVFSKYTPVIRSKRKIATHNLSVRRRPRKQLVVADLVSRVTCLLNDLVQDPENFYKYVRRVTSSIACILVFGQRGKTYENFWGHHRLTTRQFGEALEPGANPPVDELPILKYFPGRWKTRARHAATVMHDIWTEARDRVNERRARGDHRQSLADRLLTEYSEKGGCPMSDHALTKLFGELVEGGAETTSSSMLTMIFSVARNPWVQKKAQVEIDALCGADRMPEWADFDKLPYINCIVKEGMRWRPAIATGIPHCVTEDDYYQGMLIPKDSTIFIPIWALHHSERYGYADPHAFNPDRYLNHPKLANDYAGSPDHNQRDHYGYGAGRRMCPGIHLAERNQWRITAKILWAFEISEPTDPKTGEVLHLDPEAFTEGLLHAPKPYKVVLKPRSEAHVQTIKRHYADALKVLAPYE
ncbi:hypothetical protein A1O3_03245 [Capronia epimyces CBS 606.96]|uniref:Cytochrome P450 oxidoreductase n=1 Tax=Capronia epimyces CBS 606.96 TaxID=1182542 RepID=W9YLQ5_9EURO|nr:uncharacterized protein A1O3_03245 [Capronia epimyces CBS 606.96]EXJ90176.1 hypothetical protein A1O3_03245 [Capronia epimyces CBS 606.96]